MSRAEDVGQILPCAIDVGPRASNVTGERFGSLRAEYPCEKTRLGIRWVCRCDCGRYAIRTLARLNVTRRKGQASACSECLAARVLAQAMEHLRIAMASQRAMNSTQHAPHCSGTAPHRCQERPETKQPPDTPGLAASLILRLLEVLGG
jgi:hypothetical protein